MGRALEQQVIPVVIIGGGAAGLMAGIGAGETLGLESCSGQGTTSYSEHSESSLVGNGSFAESETADPILVLNSADKPGKKIYATGNGRCNLANRVQGQNCYYTDSHVDPYRFLTGYGSEELLRFFREEGVLFHERNGYIYPQTDQASTIVEVLLRRLRSLPVQIRNGERAGRIVRDAQGLFHIRTDHTGGNHNKGHIGGKTDKGKPGKDTYGQEYLARRVIIAAGGRVNEGFGCDGSGLRLSAELGHHVISPIPALCGLRSGAEYLKSLAGVRAQGMVSLYADRELLGRERGELQLTDYGISGIPVFQLSRLAGRALEKGRSVSAVLDLVPGLSPKAYEAYIEEKLQNLTPEDTFRDLFLGVCHEKIGAYILHSHDLVAEKKIRKAVSGDEARRVCHDLLLEVKALTFPITATNGYDQAQVTAGGVALEEVDPDTMASRLEEGLYLAGEVLDVDGICGGYNLTFAMATGRKAGQSAARSLR